MREAAEDAETSQFNPQIDAASGDAKKALQVGKIKNKVLKLAGEVQVINIKARSSSLCATCCSDARILHRLLKLRRPASPRPALKLISRRRRRS
jgi:hypothetical protein